MKAVDLMSDGVAVIPSELSLKEAARRMQTQGLEAFAVLDANDEVVGIVTDRDISLGVVSKGIGADTPVSRIMRPVVQCSDRARLDEAVTLMETHDSETILVRDADRTLIGVLAMPDVVRHRLCGRGRLARPTIQNAAAAPRGG